MTTHDDFWAAVVKRDVSYDGSFVYGVRTTGVYCRPSCPSRRARRENVRFFNTHRDAEAAGFRACQRCSPDGAPLRQQHAGKIAEICRVIESSETPPNLRSLAGLAGLSPFHFHRLFRNVTGVTPKQYATAHRARRVRQELQRCATVTEAAYAAGFNSSSRFYESSALGMTPSSYRRGGAGETIHYATGNSSLGPVLVARSRRGVCSILFGDDDLRARFPQATLIPDDDHAALAAAIQMVDTPGTSLDLPLDIRGTAFQQRVWKALQAIPSGQTVSYTEIAQRIGTPTSTRAVASACAANPLAVAIPCHRVLRADGNLAGYRWGLERKRALLKREEHK